MPKKVNDRLILAGDIGGTKTILGLFYRGANGQPRLLVSRTYPSREATSLTAILDDFIAYQPETVVTVCLGVPGAVISNHVHPSNLPWSISRPALKRRFGWPALILINDLVATAHAVRWLNRREIHWLRGQRRNRQHNLGIIAPGTGLGISLLINNWKSSLPVASEGGHLGFAPGDEVEMELWHWLRKQYGRVTLEMVLSGPGLVNIHTWLTTGRSLPGGYHPENNRLTPKEIVAAAMTGSCPLCATALERFVIIFGRAAGDLALMGLTLGGIFLAGGIPPKILPALEKDDFLASFDAKGKLDYLMRRIPVAVITNEKAALLGAAAVALTEVAGASS